MKGLVKGLVAAGMLVKGPVTAGADCKAEPLKSNPAMSVGQVKIKFIPEAMMVRRGAKERQKTVPLPELPPEVVVPYRALPDRSRVPEGCAPSLLVCGAGYRGVAVK